MASPSPLDARRRAGALTCGWIALAGIGLLLGSLVLIELTVTGATSMVGVLPMVGIFVTWWIWLILGITAAALGAGASRPALPVSLGVAACVLSFIGFLWVAGGMSR
ncbi:hypothetical protein [Microbacterium hibisci]|uniref:hypothetical protein n=1 Tax=Microbacterium hibisci TaxID=2036000 RepID=UPI0019447DB4|nr:hypothetical protein [Microbacterium hibisci]